MRGSRPGERGQGLVEFGLILSLIVVVAVVTLVFFGPQLSWVLSLIGTGIERTS
jgi:Flp pilus assembly pilin Flp